ncbi:NaeI family type II restriction endonuclease [Streptomyces diastatochromogenes]|uniref:NaeI family type II restriction endonuclease n=1 Tax=Streptomyces diastatochromogenes TaxID=42236 RepID=UPI00366529C7
MPESLFANARTYAGEAVPNLTIPIKGNTDVALEEVIEEIKFKGKGRLERRFANLFRRSIDEILDGPRTKRFDFGRVSGPEKSYLGTKVEIIARAEFDFGDGRHLDYLIAGHEVDAKFSATGDWMIAPKNVGQIILVMEASEQTSQFSVGVVRAHPDLLRPAPTRDRKRSFHSAGKKSIRWLIRDSNYPRNQLMEWHREDPEAVDAIFATVGGGQPRVNELFRRKQRILISKLTVDTVAAQEDSSKRVRDARIDLRKDGILILGYQERHRRIGAALGIPHIRQGEWASITVHPAEPDCTAPIFLNDGVAYRMAKKGDVPVPAPEIPS